MTPIRYVFAICAFAGFACPAAAHASTVSIVDDPRMATGPSSTWSYMVAVTGHESLQDLYKHVRGAVFEPCDQLENGYVTNTTFTYLPAATAADENSVTAAATCRYGDAPQTSR